MRLHSLGLAGILGLVLVLGGATGALSQQVGTAGAVNPAAQSAPPGGALRTMNVGGNVVFKERINTSDSGSVQLVFVDRTTMNIGPNSQLTIDEFVYDPAANTGRMTATLTKGVMRFVGGQSSHTGGATIKTPATTLGVRGGVVTVRHDQQNGTRAINHFGIMTAQTPQGQEIIRRPGFALNVASVNTAPTSPTRAPQSEIDGNNRQLTSAGGQTGGRTQTPTDEGASKAVGQANSQVSTTSIEGQKQTTQQATQRTTAPPPPTVASSDVLQLVQQTATTGSQQQAVTTLSTATKTLIPDPPRRFFAMDGDATRGEVVPTAFISPGIRKESLILGYGAGGRNADGSINTTSGILMASMVINGTGTRQTSTIVGMAGTVYDIGGEYVFDAGLRGTTRLNANNSMGRLSSSVASVPNGVTLDSNYSPVTANVDQNDIFNTGVRTQQSGFYYPGGGGASVNYTFTATADRVANPVGLGSARPTVELRGISAGLMRTDSFSSGNFNGPSFPVWGDTYISLTEGRRFNADINAFRLGSSPNNADNFTVSNLQFGYRGDGSYGNSTYVDYNNFLALNSSIANVGTPLGTVNGNALSLSSGLLVTNDTVSAKTFFPGVTFCNCDYSRWGFWSTELQRTGITVNNSPDLVRDRLHMGTWAAGVPTTHIEVPTTGTATYVGHMIGSFKTGSAEYIAAGNFRNVVNFGTNAGTFTVTGLDGRNYSGSTFIGRADRTLMAGAGSTTAGSAAATMAISGAFMRGTGGPVGEMLGGFNVAGQGGYIGAGTFMARN